MPRAFAENIKNEDKLKVKTAISGIESLNEQKKAFVSLLGLKVLEKKLKDQDIQILSKNNTYSELLLLRDFDIAAVIAQNNVKIAAISYLGESHTRVCIPKSHFIKGMPADIYVGIRLEKNIEKAEIIGFIEASLIDRQKSGEKYIFVNNNELKGIEEIKQAVEKIANNKSLQAQNKPHPAQDHQKTQGLFFQYIENRISSADKEFFARHIANCGECSVELNKIIELDNKIKNTPKQLLKLQEIGQNEVSSFEEDNRDYTLEILSGLSDEPEGVEIDDILAGLSSPDSYDYDQDFAAQSLVENTFKAPEEDYKKKRKRRKFISGIVSSSMGAGLINGFRVTKLAIVAGVLTKAGTVIYSAQGALLMASAGAEIINTVKEAAFDAAFSVLEDADMSSIATELEAGISESSETLDFLEPPDSLELLDSLDNIKDMSLFGHEEEGSEAGNEDSQFDYDINHIETIEELDGSLEAFDELDPVDAIDDFKDIQAMEAFEDLESPNEAGFSETDVYSHYEENREDEIVNFNSKPEFNNKFTESLEGQSIGIYDESLDALELPEGEPAIFSVQGNEETMALDALPEVSMEDSVDLTSVAYPPISASGRSEQGYQQHAYTESYFQESPANQVFRIQEEEPFPITKTEISKEHEEFLAQDALENLDTSYNIDDLLANLDEVENFDIDDMKTEATKTDETGKSPSELEKESIFNEIYDDVKSIPEKYKGIELHPEIGEKEIFATERIANLQREETFQEVEQSDDFEGEEEEIIQDKAKKSSIKKIKMNSKDAKLAGGIAAAGVVAAIAFALWFSNKIPSNQQDLMSNLGKSLGSDNQQQGGMLKPIIKDESDQSANKYRKSKLASDRARKPLTPEDSIKMAANKPVPKDLSAVLADAFTRRSSEVDIKNVSWEITADMAQDSIFKNYIMVTGQALKSALERNLAVSSETAPNAQMVIKSEIDLNGNMRSSIIRQSSGSDEVDRICLDTYKSVLLFTKLPKIETDRQYLKVNLIVSF